MGLNLTALALMREPFKTMRIRDFLFSKFPVFRGAKTASRELGHGLINLHDEHGEVAGRCKIFSMDLFVDAGLWRRLPNADRQRWEVVSIRESKKGSRR